jgi:hypothetical protein
MALRITLIDEDPGRQRTMGCHAGLPRAVHRARPAVAEPAREDPMLLYYADEPTVGTRFRYAGVEWEVVDYDDGWVARMVVEHVQR